jgi:hexulose-6-phosphate isomerase
MHTRRDFLAAATATLAAASLSRAEPPVRLKKAVKYGMIRAGDSPQEKLELIKRLGFQGIEVDSPSTIDREALRKASEQTGIAIHGVIDSVHWKEPLSSPDPAARAKGLEALKTALDDAKFFGADTVLLVPGVARDGVTYEQCWERSQAEVRKVVPLAERLGVRIAIETVWNDFITKPEQMNEYVDAFQSPAVGAYFDCSNMLKYGVSSPDWIRKLGKRMLKFDFKGYSLAKAKAAGNDRAGFAVEIGEGDEDWPKVLEACAAVGYRTWATAEVAGGGEERLTDISRRMDRILGLA